ncbi:hypothetical protein Tco_1514910 [Tanacetum coccineum]
MHMYIAWDKVVNPRPQVLPSFEVYTLPVTYPKEVEETIGIPIEIEPLDKTPLKDLGLNTCNHDNPLSSREVPSFDEPEPQPQPLPNCPSLDVSLGDKRGPEPPIKPHSLDNFRVKEVDHLTIHTPPSPHVASFHPKDVFCYYHPCIDDPKKHYRFKTGLLGQSGSLCVDFSNLEVIEDDWELESIEVYFLGRGLSLPIRPKEVEKRGDGVTMIKRRRQDLHHDGVRDPATASGRDRLKEDIESSTWRRRHNFKATPSRHLDFAVDGNLRELSGKEAWEAIENFAQGQKEWDNPPNIISEQEVANLLA